MDQRKVYRYRLTQMYHRFVIKLITKTIIKITIMTMKIFIWYEKKRDLQQKLDMELVEVDQETVDHIVDRLVQVQFIALMLFYNMETM